MTVARAKVLAIQRFHYTNNRGNCGGGPCKVVVLWMLSD